MTTTRLVIDELKVELTRGTIELESPAALEGASLYLIEGASGSGKSTLARVLLGLGEFVRPTLVAHAKARLEGVAGATVTLSSAEGYAKEARAHIAYLPQASSLAFIDDLGTETNLRLYSRLPAAPAAAAIESLAKRFGVHPLPASLARASGGERMRLSAVRALLPRGTTPGAGEEPALLIADEPTTALDPQAARELARALIDIAASPRTVVLVITHEARPFLAEQAPVREPPPPGIIRITRCKISGDWVTPEHEVARLVTRAPAHPPRPRSRVSRALSTISQAVGALVLAPLAFARGLAGLDIGTWLFVASAATVVGVTLGYFAFAKMPRREILEPLFLPEFLRELGQVMLLVLPPLFAALFASAKTGAAQAARLASSVRSGLLETLALARIHPASYALVPVVLGQVLVLGITTVMAMVLCLGAAAAVFLATGSELSLDLALAMMLGALERAEGWQTWLALKTIASGAVAGAVAASFGLRPSSGREEDVSLAVHRTLLWTLLAVLATQCAFIIGQFG